MAIIVKNSSTGYYLWKIVQLAIILWKIVQLAIIVEK